MYGKLRFTSTATAAQRNMSIVKLITDYYDPPATVSFDGYPGIDSATCEVIGTDSSHWTFAGTGGSESLGSNSLTYSEASAWHGSQYTLKSTYDTGHIVYADIKLTGNAEHANIYNSTQAHTMIIPRNKFGTSLEERQLGNHTITNVTDADLRGQGISHHSLPEIHIFADQTKLTLVGAQYDQAERYVYNSLFQFDRPAHMKYQDKQQTIADSNVPCCWLLCGTGYRGGGTTTSQPNSASWSSGWDDNQTHGFVVSFPGNIYNHKKSIKFRNVSWGMTNGNSYVDDNTDNCTIDDGSTKTPTATGANPGLPGYDYGHAQYLKGFSPADWIDLGGFALRYTTTSSQITGTPDINFTNASSGQGYIFDSNGNKTIPISPMEMDWHWAGGEVINMSNKSGQYKTSGGAGLWADSAEIGGDKYQYFPTSAYAGILIKRG